MLMRSVSGSALLALLGLWLPGVLWAQLIDPARTTIWNPGILADTQLNLPLGNDKLPVRTTICAAPNPGDNLNTAITNCPEGQVVQLKAATYTVNYTIVLKKGVVLRGAGSQGAGAGGTTVVRTGGGSVISIGTSQDGACYPWGSYSEPASALTADAAKGSTLVRVGANAAKFHAGDFALIDQVDDASMQTPNDCPYFKRVTDPVVRSISERVEISSVDTTGGTVTLRTPLHWTFRIASPYLAEITRVTATMTKWAGIEKLLLQGGSNPGYNGQMAGGIDISNAAYCWVKDVQTDGAIGGMHIALRGAYRCVVRDSWVHHSATYGFGTDCYGIVVGCGSADSLVENNIVRYMNKPLQLSVSGGGNVLGYNYADNAWATPPAFQEVPFDSHCSYPHMELVEGNWAPHMATPDTHGATGYVTFLRNYASSQFAFPPVYGSTEQQTGNVQAVGFCPKCNYMNVVANVLGPAAGSDPRSAVDIDTYVCDGDAMSVCIYSFGDNGTSEVSYQTAFLHGNFDTVHDAVIWDPDVDDHQLPASLYLAGKPAWWPAGSPWPWTGPDLVPMVGTLPAKARSDAIENPIVSLSIDDVTLVEGNSGTRLTTFTVALSAVSGLSVSVGWATADQTAVAPGDYTAGSGTLAFAPGDTTKEISVVVKGDVEPEDHETFRVLLAGSTNAVIADGEGIGTILDDEAALMLPEALALGPLTTGVLQAGDTVAVQPSPGATPGHRRQGT